jgi:hypothetical protein
MTDSITVKPNQSMLDVILQGCGTLEGGMQMMAVNGRSISEYPDVGDTIKVSDAQTSIQNDPAVLAYLQQNNIVIGTAAISNEPAISGVTVVLKPVMKAVPSISTPPSSTVNYEFDLYAASDFVNVYSIPHAHYPANDNLLWYLEEDRMLEGDTPFYDLCSGRYMDDKSLHYSLGWSLGRGFMMIWNDLNVTNKSVTFVDIKGNEAYCAPLIILDNVTQIVRQYLIADLSVEFISTTHDRATIRLTRFHLSISYVDWVTHVMTWTHDAAGGTPDPLDPGNPDKTILTLPRGTYTFGVSTVYINVAFSYPPSAFTEVVEIS